MCKKEKDDIFSPMISQEKPGKSTKTKPKTKSARTINPLDRVKVRNQWQRAETGVPIEVIAWHSTGGSRMAKLTKYAEEIAHRDTVLGNGWYGARDEDVALSITRIDPQPYLVRLENPYVFVTDDRNAPLRIGNEELDRIRNGGYDSIIVKPRHRNIQHHDRSAQQVVVFSPSEQIQLIDNPEGGYSTRTSTREFKSFFRKSKVVDEQGKPLKVYHLWRPDVKWTRMPAFFTREKSGAEWYKYDRGDEDGTITEAYLCFENPFIIDGKESAMAFIDLARRAGVEIALSDDEHGWSIEAPEIRQHSPYEGLNINDLVYIPAVIRQLFDEGYDGIIASDVLENTEIDIYIAIAPGLIRPLPSTSR